MNLWIVSTIPDSNSKSKLNPKNQIICLFSQNWRIMKKSSELKNLLKVPKLIKEPKRRKQRTPFLSNQPFFSLFNNCPAILWIIWNRLLSVPEMPAVNCQALCLRFLPQPVNCAAWVFACLPWRQWPPMFFQHTHTHMITNVQSDQCTCVLMRCDNCDMPGMQCVSTWFCMLQSN